MAVINVTLSSSFTITKEDHSNYMSQFVSESQRRIYAFINNVILCGVISTFGTIANIINLIIFYKQGLNTTINISFFAMAISDLCSVILQQGYNVFATPWIENSGLPMEFSDVQYVTCCIPREAFARITCLITVYITAERCLCIAFPLHVKQMITPRRTATVISVIFCLTLVSVIPLCSTTYIDWKFFPERNKTLLGLIFTEDNSKIEGAVFFVHAVFGVFCLVAIVVLTLILVHKLRQKSEWRKTAHVPSQKSEAISTRDKTTMSMIVLIASILTICYTPSVLLCLGTFIEPRFNVGGRYFDLYYTLWSFALVFENINSSVNIFLYFKMSTKYRQTFRELFSLCVNKSHQSKSEYRKEERDLP